MSRNRFIARMNRSMQAQSATNANIRRQQQQSQVEQNTLVTMSQESQPCTNQTSFQSEEVTTPKTTQQCEGTNMTYQEYKAALASGVHTVYFTKVNGDKRRMDCTLNPKYIPEDMRPSADSQVKENTEVVRVYDIGASGWRSFRVDLVSRFV